MRLGPGLPGILAGTLIGDAVDGRRGVIIGAALAAAAYQALLFVMCRLRTGIDPTALSLLWDRRRVIAGTA